jgi:hypothetical protein
MIGLDTLLALGILVNLVKGGDLLLRPHQRRKVQALCERLHRRLASQRPIAGLQRLASERGQRRLMLVGSGEFLVVVGADVSLDMWSGGSATIGSFGVLLCAGAMLLSVLSRPLVTRLGGPKLMRWLLGDLRCFAFLRRFAVVCIAGMTVLGMYQAILWGAASLLGTGDPFDTLALPLEQVGPGTLVVGVGLLVAWPPFVYFWILTQVAGAALSMCVLTRLGGLLLTVVRALAWRVAEYNKGAWAALVLGTTVVLGLLRLILTGAG